MCFNAYLWYCFVVRHKHVILAVRKVFRVGQHTTELSVFLLYDPYYLPSRPILSISCHALYGITDHLLNIHGFIFYDNPRWSFPLTLWKHLNSYHVTMYRTVNMHNSANQYLLSTRCTQTVDITFLIVVTISLVRTL